MTNAELKGWLEANQEKFKTYSVTEIEALAKAVGIEADTFFIRGWKNQQNFKEAI